MAWDSVGGDALTDFSETKVAPRQTRRGMTWVGNLFPYCLAKSYPCWYLLDTNKVLMAKQLVTESLRSFSQTTKRLLGPQRSTRVVRCNV